MTEVIDATFAKAQAAELANWEKDVENASRVLYELVEHSNAAEPLRRIVQGRRLHRALEVGVGCFGLGFLAVHLSDLFDTIDGLDPLPRLELSLRDKALNEYVHDVQARVNYVQSIGETMPLESASYDLVSCVNVVDHAQQPEKIIREIDRVLKPGGLLVFAVSTLSTLGELKWKLNRWRHPNNWHFVAHPHTYQWRRADRLVKSIRGEVLWRTKPSALQRFAGRGRMSHWILRKAI